MKVYLLCVESAEELFDHKLSVSVVSTRPNANIVVLFTLDQQMLSDHEVVRAVERGETLLSVGGFQHVVALGVDASERRTIVVFLHVAHGAVEFENEQ